MTEHPRQFGPLRAFLERLRERMLACVTLSFLGLFVLMVLALIVADLLYVDRAALAAVLRSPEVRSAIRLSAITSGASLLLIVLFAVPIGYALSRYRFPGHAVLNTIVTLPIVLPPLVIGVSLLVFFRTPVGRFIEGSLLRFVYTVQGIVLCQFLVSASYGIRAAEAAFDAADVRLEQLAWTLGCTRGRAFRRVALPLARNGLIAGAIVSWAHAVGVFGPLQFFAGAVPMKTEVMPTRIFLELSIGQVQAALALSLVMLAMAATGLVFVHRLAGRRRWW